MFSAHNGKLIHVRLSWQRQAEHEVSPLEINQFMDRYKIPRYIGRFPNIRMHRDLVDVALREVDNFSEKIKGKSFRADQKSKMLIRRVALKMYHSW